MRRIDAVDWQALMPESAPVGTSKTGTVPVENSDCSHLKPLVPTPCSHLGGGGELSNNNKLGGLFPLFPLFPPSGEGKGVMESEKSSPGVAGRLDQIRARNEGEAVRYPLHPAGVVLCLAWCDAVAGSSDERSAALTAMTTVPPAEQVKRWHGACIEQGLKPWELIYMKAPAEGTECGKCKHLTSREYRHPDERRHFHWACALGYLLHEYGCGCERVWIAPPECSSWERWQPAR